MPATMPFSATDFAKALRVMLGLAQDLRKLVEHRRTRKAAADLDALVFRPGGMAEPVARIAAGTATPSDFSVLRQMMSASADEVRKSLKGLTRYRSTLRERFGMNAALDLDILALEKLTLRLHIASLSDDNVRNSNEYKREARDIYQSIKAINTRLIELHDLIINPVATLKKRERRLEAAMKSLEKELATKPSGKRLAHQHEG